VLAVGFFGGGGGGSGAATSIAPTVVTVNAGNSPYTLLPTDSHVECDTSAAARAITLHAASTAHMVSVTVLGSNACTITRAGADTIGGASDTSVAASGAGVGFFLVSNGSTAWRLQ